jgi:hypothetical protein
MPSNFDPFQRRCTATTAPDPRHQSMKGDLLVLPHVHDAHQRPELQVCSLQSQALSCQLQFAIEEYYYFLWLNAICATVFSHFSQIKFSKNSVQA